MAKIRRGKWTKVGVMIVRGGQVRVREGCKNKGPSEYHSVEFGPDHLQQLRVEEVLTQAEGAPVTSAHAAQPGVAEETYGKRHQHTS